MRLTVGRRQLDIDPGETVLQALARQGVTLPSACRSGVCHACLLRAVQGNPGAESRAGLRESLTVRGFFLACMARPGDDLTVALAGDEAFTPARLKSAEPVTDSVLRVWLKPASPLEFRPGQHVAVRRASGITGLTGVTRVYSIANQPHEAAADGIELHVRVYQGGAMSGWLAQAEPGSPLSLGMPAGDCCYQPRDPSAPLLLAGTGTGIAPLAAIARNAVAHAHRGPIVLIHGAARPDGTYLAKLTGQAWPQEVRTRTCTQSAGEDITEAALEELAAFPDPRSARAYLCGGPGAVHRTRRALFLAGMSLRRIHADGFSLAVT
jgi:CDP-4-dehydro-6-deoxyglucose reductase, E3